MKEIDALIKKALKYKESGFTDYEIAKELNVSKETANWLLNKAKEKKPTGDVKIGWKSLGVYPYRMSAIADALADVILEEVELRELEIDTIIGIAINGIPFATLIAEQLGLELAVFRPQSEKTGAFSSNFATVKDKHVVIVDDVIGTGGTMKQAIKQTKTEKGTPELCLSIINKRVVNDIENVPLRALIRARAL